MEGARATTASRPAREKQQRKCSSCGKLGHTKSHCWLAHPELRPKGGKSARKDPRQLQSPEASSRTSLPFMPFRFLDLPGEIRNRIYDEVYGEPYAVTAKMAISTLSLRSESDRYEVAMPCRAKLHIVNKQIHQETSCARSRNSFNGRLRCDRGPILPLNFEPKYEQFRSQVTKMTFFGFNNREMNGVNFPKGYWCGMEEAFPNLQEIHFEWTQVPKCDPPSESAMQNFLEGQDEYAYSDRLKVPFLAKHVNTRSNWKIIFTTTIR
ncbi:hypothetical protein EDD37DRAFT_605292 [Exophiala viscosa]|uniref:CCHC-type domain-containing protein n=1 Tax=Exophiala viscosa TaxID=2486360 RepID=A0AAN6IFW2_9EURO|nr:hypothetical protein EDD36DRAFT_120456 [Exophiala viscosa]KAI1630443.1 hypothetical protein EDD37DRAFT_605292 [Exophiala viscosa]